jgi:hypothetical protein
MPRLTTRGLALATLIVGSAAPGWACYFEDAAPPEPVYADDYAPQFYEGYVVYYDDGGKPFYYVARAVVWVPMTSGFYAGLVTYWRTNRQAYDRWFAHVGYRYRAYRTCDPQWVTGCDDAALLSRDAGTPSGAVERTDAALIGGPAESGVSDLRPTDSGSEPAVMGGFPKGGRRRRGSRLGQPPPFDSGTDSRP